ncbi:reverse transcriptase domain-containing protein [Tanacetum coccineum]|uniref:Reverse transcriptase domain-containing protein n=1 Tax=Tanacetum coccineum TaxID=301880 RepID=A0ABQ4YAN4_9ASTR
MANNTQAKVMGEVRKVRIQIGYQAYLADFLVLDIPVDKELPLLLGCPFLRTCGAMIDMGHGTMTIDVGVIKHTYYPQPRTKGYLENFESDESEDWMSCFEVYRNEIMREKCIWFRLYGKEHVFTLLEFAVLIGLYSESDVQHRLFKTHFLRLTTNDEGFNHEAYWSRIEQPRTEKKKLADIRYPLLHIMHKILVGSFMHRSGSRDKVQKPDLWLLSLLDEGHNKNMAWILAEYLSKRASGIKKSSEIYGGHFVTKIVRKLGFYNQRELAKCSKPIKSESWDNRMFRKAFNRRAKKLSPITPLEGYPSNGEVCAKGAMPSHRGTSIVPSSGYDVRGSSRGAQDDDGDDDMSDDN